MSTAPALSERRLVANRANAQLSTGPQTPEGKAKSSLNAVKTGLTGHAILLADEEEAAEYRAHVERVRDRWQPVGERERTLVQFLADTQWRLHSIPGLESALYARARLRGVELYQHEDPQVRRLLLDGETEVIEAKALKNLRLHEGRLRRQYERDKAELEQLRQERFEAEKEQAQKAATPKTLSAANGFEFTNLKEHSDPLQSRERSDRFSLCTGSAEVVQRATGV
ncbi:MAG: hypothetical protein JO182_17990 [Acidobacteriaceae bacterium]|nr:hypothetical protein [Acidobacteriaceae bacterium]